MWIEKIDGEKKRASHRDTADKGNRENSCQNAGFFLYFPLSKSVLL